MCAKSRRVVSTRLGTAIFDDLGIPAALVDLRARAVVQANTALSKWLGFATDDLAGERINDLTARIAFLWADAPPPAEPASFENHEASLRLPNGEQRHVWLSAKPLQDDDRALHLITLQDITARVQAEHQVRQLKRLYAALSQVNQTIVRVQSRTELYQSICDVAVRFGEFSAAWLGLWSEATDTLHPIVVRKTTEELPLERISESLPVPRSARANDLVVAALRSSRVMTAAEVADAGARPVWPTALAEPAHQAVAVIPFRLRGKTIGVVGLVGPDAGSLTSADEIRLLDEMGLDISYALDMLQTAAESHQAQSEVRAQAVRLQILADASQAFTAVGGDYSALLAEIVRRVAEQIGESCGIRLVSPDGRTLTLAAAHSTYPEALDIVRAVQPQAPERVDGPGLLPHVVRTGESVFLPEVTEEQSRASMSAALWSKLEHYRFRSLILVPLRAHGQNLGVMLVGRHTLALGPYTPDDLHLAEDLASRAALAISNARLLQQVQEELVERRRIEEALRASEATLQLFIEHAPAALAMFDREMRYLAVSRRWLLDYGLEDTEVIGRSHYELFPNLPERWREAHRRGLAGESLGADEDPFEMGGGRIQWTRWAVRPWKQADGLVGGIVLFIEDITDRVRVERQLATQVQRLRALRTIDQAITASLDLGVTLEVFLEQVLTQLQADGAIVLLLNQPLHRLEYAAGRGFHTTAVRNARVPVGQGFAGRAAHERRMVHIPNLSEAGGDLAQALQLEQERFTSYFGVPLIAKGQVKGVLEVYHRRPFEPDSDWLEFLISLAGQAAIAVDGAQLFDSLQRSHDDLAIAYDATIEGWSRAMDLRDHETEGHTKRVTDLVVRLALAAGLDNEALGHVRRGALLHDIGKLGIPDQVLFKPGPLDADEWALMRRHPQLAFDMLAAIPYLRPALDIPYCHHEKWDGSGYPRGLRQEQIPVAARLFAVVDVWDALRSNRPYRSAWPDERVLEHLKAESGRHFDPQVVTLFLEVLRAEA